MRTIRIINEDWLFVKEGKETLVTLPHTWNGTDGQDGGNDYYRGTCTYEKVLADTDFPAGDEVWLQLDGANSSASVFFNGTQLAVHHGGYSAFRVRLGEIRKENLIHIEVDNAPNDFVYPQQADFTFYGGIYRDVKLIGVSAQHFALDHNGSPGFRAVPKECGADYEVYLQAFCSGMVRFEIFDGSTSVGSVIAEGENPCGTILIRNAHLWDGTRDPHLYTAEASLLDGERITDQVSFRFGCRSFRIDPERGFILNGREYPLRGVARHQDRPTIGNALLPEHHREDMDLICEMGANTIRLAHYQHAQYFYDLCDERGIVVWAEIPYISKHLPNGVENTRQQMTELILQNDHHPCIVTWSLSNEITMGDISREMEENHRMLNDLVHTLDPTRPTTLAVFTTCSMDEAYLHIPDVVSYNHYFGWYGGKLTDYGPWLDRFHQKYPNMPIGMSEYGCEALNWHTSHPEQGDYTEEYQAIYHEALIRQIAERPYLWATHVWNMFDFAADGRNEGGENGMNHKGLVTFDRKYKKDSYYAYQAWLTDKPMVHLCGKRYVDRTEDVTEVRVYSNQPEVELFADGVSVGKQKRDEFPFFVFQVKNEGETKLIARAGDLTDEGLIRKVDTFNEAYRLKEEGAVLNWFEITAPEGYFSVNDTLGDIFATFRGKLLLLQVLRKLKKAKSKPAAEGEQKSGGHEINKSMMQVAMGFTVKRGINMMGGLFTKEDILALNAKLNRIRKPKKQA